MTASILFKGSVDLELLIVSFKLSSFVIVVALMYRPPNVSDIIFDELFSVLCNYVNVSLFNCFVLIGDFNVNFLVSNTSYQKLLSVTNSFSLTQTVTEPTRISNSSTLIDLIFLSSPSQLSSCVTIPPLANSDHLGLQLSLSTTVSSHRAHSKTERKLWKYNQADLIWLLK